MLQINDELKVFRNQLRREATVLAVLKKKALIEYAMPNGTTALNILQRDDILGVGPYRSVSYFGLTFLWLRALISCGAAWSGRPQKGKPCPTPSNALRIKMGAA